MNNEFPMKGRIGLTFTERAQAKALACARARNGKARRFGSGTYTGRDPLEVHYDGVLGEMGLAYLYGVEMDETILEDRGEQGADLRIRGKSVQVKTNRYWREPFLRVESHKRIACDMYALICIRDAIRLEIVGWATGLEVKHAPLMRFGTARHDNHTLREDELHRFKVRDDAPQIYEVDVRLDPSPLMSKASVSSRQDKIDDLDYQRCRKLNGVMDVPNGVVIPKLGNRRGTLINALVSIPGFPPGVRVVLEGEKEIVRGSDTKSNPGGTPISRDFYSADVKVVGDG